MGKGKTLISRVNTLLDSKAQFSPTNHRVYKENKQQKELEIKKASLEQEIQEQKNKIVKTLKIKD